MPFAHIDDTLEMYYEIDDYTDPWKTPEVMVLQHGNGRSGKFWYAWVPLLARQYRVIRPDYRCMGQSTVPPPGYQLSYSGFAKDLRILLDQLGVDRFHLVAEATGGLVSMQFAVDYPERLKSLVLCGPGPANIAGPGGSYGKKLVELIAERQGSGDATESARAEMDFRFDLTKADPDFVNWYVEEMGKSSPEGDTFVKTLNSTGDITPILSQIKTPTLIMVGEKTVFGLELFKDMQRRIPKSELQVFYGAQHHIPQMYPEECVKSTLSFLRRLSL